MLNRPSTKWFLFFVFLSALIFLGYFVQRTETLILFSVFGFLFGLYILIASRVEDDETSFWIYASIALRLALLLAIPALSDDVYRFIWDGRLLAAGQHPFEEVPRYYIEHSLNIPGIDQNLFLKLNSKNTFTIYPPVDQFIFWLSAYLGGSSVFNSIVIIRLFIVAAEIGNLLLIKKLLRCFKLPAKSVLLYALNPLVIMELTGNLHFEGVMIFFLLLSIWFLQKHHTWSAISFALAIASKILPLILLPYFLFTVNFKTAWRYYLIVGISCLLLFLPLLSVSLFEGFRKSIGYYFNWFEFNASIYYLVREWGWYTYGYNIIQTVGWKLALWSTMFIVTFMYLHSVFQKSERSREEQFIEVSTFVFCIYLSFATTVHPWYIITPLALSVFTKFRFMILWSGLVVLTYAGYSATGFSENYWLTAAEYTGVILFLMIELFAKKKSGKSRERDSALKIS